MIADKCGKQKDKNCHDILIVKAFQDSIVILLNKRSENKKYVISKIRKTEPILDSSPTFPDRQFVEPGINVNGQSKDNDDHILEYSLVLERIDNHRKDIEDKVLEKGEGEPIARLIRIPWILVICADSVDENCKEEGRRNHQLHELMRDDIPSSGEIPGALLLVEQPTTEEEEHRHQEMPEEVTEYVHLLDYSIITPCDVVPTNDKEDCKATHCIEIAYTRMTGRRIRHILIVQTNERLPQKNNSSLIIVLIWGKDIDFFDEMEIFEGNLFN